jgi:hypothetical protein
MIREAFLYDRKNVEITALGSGDPRVFGGHKIRSPAAPGQLRKAKQIVISKCKYD